MRARYYNPEIKRFINQDILLGSISDSTSLNRYSYVNGNPISYIDPFGLESQSSSSDWHSFLGFSGFIPYVGILFDTVDAIYYGVEGNWEEAGISTLAIVPIVGDAGKASIKVTKAATTNKTGYIKYGELDDLGRTTSSEAYITKDMIGTGSGAKGSIYPSGWQKGQNYHRGHVIARDLGGTGKDGRNLTTLHAHANTPIMRGHEQEVKRVVVGGENVMYKSTPIYVGEESLARGITLQATGDKGYGKYLTILNKGK